MTVSVGDSKWIVVTVDTSSRAAVGHSFFLTASQQPQKWPAAALTPSRSSLLRRLYGDSLSGEEVNMKTLNRLWAPMGKVFPLCGAGHSRGYIHSKFLLCRGYGLLFARVFPLLKVIGL